MRGESVAYDLKLDWENSEHSEFRINCYIKDWLSTPFRLLMERKSQLAEGEYEKAFGMIPNDLPCYKYMFYGLEKSSAADRELRRCSKEFDSDAFWAGEQGVLFVIAIPEESGDIGDEEEESEELECVLSYDNEKQKYRFQGKSGQKYQYSFKENTLHNGDEVHILDSGKKELFSAPVVVSTNWECEKKFCQEMSGGEQQRVSIARALVTKPAVIFADEPSGNLDGENAKNVAEILAKASEQYHQTILMVTHDRQMADYADRILCISDGVVE